MRVQDESGGWMSAAIPLRTSFQGLRRLVRRGDERYPREDVVAAVVCLLPAGLILGTFVFYPILWSGYLSLTSWNGFSPTVHFVGLANYAHLINDAVFWNSLSVTARYALGVVILNCSLGLIVAVGLDAPLRGRSLYRTIYFLPVVTSSVAAATIWGALFDTAGYANVLMGQLHLPQPDWLGNPSLALISLVMLTAWTSIGLNTVLYLTGLQAIPVPLYEAARLDGASAWQQLRHITFPLVAPTTFLVAVLSIINAFQAFDIVYVLTGGGPVGSTDVLGYFLYRTTFQFSQFGYGASIAYVVFAIIFSTTLIQWRLSGSGSSALG